MIIYEAVLPGKGGGLTAGAAEENIELRVSLAILRMLGPIRSQVPETLVICGVLRRSAAAPADRFSLHSVNLF
jgi:hypothetical protein